MDSSWEAFPNSDDLREECLLVQNLSYFGPGSGLRVFLEVQGDFESNGAAGMENSLARASPHNPLRVITGSPAVEIHHSVL